MSATRLGQANADNFKQDKCFAYEAAEEIPQYKYENDINANTKYGNTKRSTKCEIIW